MATFNFLEMIFQIGMLRHSVTWIMGGRRCMANWDPPQPLWKRNTAGILDFLFAAAVFGVPLFMLFATNSTPQPGTYLAENHLEVLSLTGWPRWLHIALIIGYFIVLGRTGGTVLQRAFGMTRAVRQSGNQNGPPSKESGSTLRSGEG
jgi:hypothetical protein